MATFPGRKYVTEGALQATGLGIIVLLVAALSFSLNHTTRVAGFNLSLADPLLLATLFFLAMSAQLYAMRYSVIFFFSLVAISLSASLFITPIFLDVRVEPNGVFADFVKLTISFLYFVAGSSIAKIGLHSFALRWFAIGTACVALFGIAMEILGIRLFRESFYLGDLRFQGFMSDPNFYAVVTCAGFVYFAYSTSRPLVVKVVVLPVLFLSIIFSGSKTGLVIFGLISVLIFATRVRESKKFGPVLLLIFAFSLVFIFLERIWNFLATLSVQLSESIPQLERTMLLFSDDPLEGLSSDGSGREAVWSVGLSIIESSPIFGVGIGSYSVVSTSLYGQSGLAHNTYIQLAAEWGLILFFVLLVWILTLLVQVSRRRDSFSTFSEVVILRDVVIVFLIGSMSLSLNNARMLWFFLGILAVVHYRMKVSHGCEEATEEIPHRFGLRGANRISG